MKFGFVLMAAVVLFSLNAFSQSDTVEARIVVIGDAGSFKKDANGHDRHYVVSAAKKTVPLDEKTTILYIGDNLYYTGLPDNALKTYDIRRQVLDSQIDIALGTKAKVYFIPGNHDWDAMRADGWEAIRREQLYVDTSGAGKNVEFFPKGGCPGPVELDINKDVVMIVMDSQWWLHKYDKPGVESDCDAKTREQAIAILDDMLTKNSNKLILFAEHHPLKSFGIHGGYFTLKQYIFPFTDAKPKWYFPLPVIGSIYPITRSVFGTPQDLPHPTYANMINQLQSVLKQHSNVIYLAGHEHNLQLIKDTSSYYVVSGAGTNKTRVAHNKNLLFGKQQYGFMVLTVSTNKNVNFSYYTVYGDSVVHAYDSTLVNFSNTRMNNVDTGTANVAKSYAQRVSADEVIAQAQPAYDSISSFKRFFLGNNYRKEWAAPVRMKVFDVKKQNGGFTIDGIGGGKQTLTLRLTDKDSVDWVLRSINKNPLYVLPQNQRGIVAKPIVEDMVSAAQPYAPLAIADLARAVNVPEAAPQLFYVSDDPALGVYRSKFSNQVVMLEKREPTFNGENAINTSKLFDKLIENNNNRLDQQEVLRARLLDIFIGDYDREEDQWKWGSTGIADKGKLYYAIPRDRDQSFFYSDGLLLKLASFRLLPFLKGFRDNIQNQKQFNYIQRHFDRYVLNGLDKNAWQQTITDFNAAETDSVISMAVHNMPAEITAIDGKTIIQKLEARRNTLPVKAMKYYRFLSRRVDVVGTNDKEYFHVYNLQDGLGVDVYKRSKKSLYTSALMYRRTFEPSVTKEIRLYGLNDNDFFEVDSTVHSSIKLRIIGGKGKDTFDINGRTSNYIYDLNTEKNFVVHPHNSKLNTSGDPKINEFEPSAYEYNLNRFPNLVLGVNSNDGFIAGFGFLRRTYGFRKEPYATEQKLSMLVAPGHTTYQVNYSGGFNHVLGKEDVLVNSTIVNPVLNYYFGAGNNTKIDDSKSLDFYRTRYNYTETDVLIRKRFNSVLHISAGPVVYHYWNKFKDNNTRILAKPDLTGLDSADVFSQKTYVGGKLSVLINNLDNVLMPTRGINWLTTFTSLDGVSKNSRSFTSLTSNMEVHAALTDPAKLVTIVKLGGGHVYSNHYEYFQLLNLGANNFLRGFRSERFSGTSMAYASVEERVKLFQSNSYLLPGEVGLLGFGETGRVWLRYNASQKWHNDFGAGFYYAAYNYVLITGSIAFSKEDKLFNFSLGTKFNITF